MEKNKEFEVRFTKNFDGRLMTRVNLSTMTTDWFSGKVFFPDRSFRDVVSGPAMVSISFEKEKFGFLTGHMIRFDETTPNDEDLKQWILCNMPEEIVEVDHPLRGRYFQAVFNKNTNDWARISVCTQDDREVCYTGVTAYKEAMVYDDEYIVKRSTPLELYPNDVLKNMSGWFNTEYKANTEPMPGIPAGSYQAIEVDPAHPFTLVDAEGNGHLAAGNGVGYVLSTMDETGAPDLRQFWVFDFEEFEDFFKSPGDPANELGNARYEEIMSRYYEPKYSIDSRSKCNFLSSCVGKKYSKLMYEAIEKGLIETFQISSLNERTRVAVLVEKNMDRMADFSEEEQDIILEGIEKMNCGAEEMIQSLIKRGKIRPY